MNRYYEKQSGFYSEIGFTRIEREKRERTSLTETVVRFLTWLFIKLSAEKVRRIEKAVAISGALIGMIGVVGAMESGALALFPGFLIGTGLVYLEYRLLRGKKKPTDSGAN